MTAGVAPPVVGAHEDVHVTGRRILATVVDGLVFGLLYAVMAAAFGTFPTLEFGHWTAAVVADVPPLAAVAYGLIVVLYYVLMEGYLGQTVGKMVLGIKVVKESTDEVPGIKAAVIRTVVRVVDSLFSYLVAFVAVVATEKRQRLGTWRHTPSSSTTNGVCHPG